MLDCVLGALRRSTPLTRRTEPATFNSCRSKSMSAQRNASTSPRRSPSESATRYRASSEAYHGATFGLIQSSVSTWLNILIPVPTPEDRLLFILSYLKLAPLQLAHGALFGLSQSNANKWIHILLVVLNQTLSGSGDAPTRHLVALEQRLLELRSTDAARSPLFFTMAPNGQSPAPEIALSKKRIGAARKSDIP